MKSISKALGCKTKPYIQLEFECDSIDTMHWVSSSTTLLLLHALIALAQETAASTNDSLLWGPYRPNLYFGIRPRIPNSLSTGLLWGRVEDYNNVQNRIRYTCEQNEGMGGYGWDVFDPRTGGVQTIKDMENGIDLQTSFVKFDQGRGGWGARVEGTVREDAEPGSGSHGGVSDRLKTSVWFSVSVAGIGGLEVEDAQAAADLGFSGEVVLNGQASDLGDFRLTISEPEEGNARPVHNHQSYPAKPLDHTFVHSVQVPEEALWQSKGTFLSSPKHNRCFTSLSC